VRVFDAREIVELSAQSGCSGVTRWVKDHAAWLHENPNAASDLFEATRQHSHGAAFLLARILYCQKLAPFDVTKAQDLAGWPRVWSTGIWHIQMPHILERIRQALDSGDVIFGYHRFYCGACGPEAVVFTTFSTVEEHLQAARVGDDFMLASLREFRERDELLEPSSDAIRLYLTSKCGADEVFLINPSIPRVEVLWEGNVSEDEVVELFNTGRELYAAPFSWDQEFFVDAKKPDENGAIPLNGTY